MYNESAYRLFFWSFRSIPDRSQDLGGRRRKVLSRALTNFSPEAAGASPGTRENKIESNYSFIARPRRLVAAPLSSSQPSPPPPPLSPLPPVVPASALQVVCREHAVQSLLCRPSRRGASGPGRGSAAIVTLDGVGERSRVRVLELLPVLVGEGLE
jgi:hypothetical protein